MLIFRNEPGFLLKELQVSPAIWRKILLDDETLLALDTFLQIMAGVA